VTLKQAQGGGGKIKIKNNILILYERTRSCYFEGCLVVEMHEINHTEIIAI